MASTDGQAQSEKIPATASVAPPLASVTIDELAAAIENDQLMLMYQPQVTPDGATTVSVEALVRWNHPVSGLVSPELFIPLAEKSGLVIPLGAWALRRACADAARWPAISVSVNVSPIQFRDPAFVDFVIETATSAGLAFNRLELEITESAYFDDIERGEMEIRHLHGLGFKVALDDFGTGFASLSYVRRLPLSKIKIDKSFVDDIDNLSSAAIVHAVVAMSRALGLKVTAEGVENAQQQRFLKAAGCHYLQGYLFSRPLTADEVTTRLAGEKSGPR